MKSYRIIHFSDIHAGGGGEDCLAYIDKRWVGVFNYRFRRRFQHDLSVLERFVDLMIEDPPDLLVCTGDLTSTGQAGEFAKTMRPLRRLLRRNIPMLFVPGNHDCYVYRKRCMSAMRSVFRQLNATFDLEFDSLPQKRTFLGIDFLIVNESWPSNLISSCGYLKKNAQQFLLENCAAPKERPRIVIGHYPMFEHQPLLRIRHRLWGQRPILPLLRNGDIDLSLHGHIHRPFTRLAPDGHGEMCAGSLTRNGCYSELTFRPEYGIFNKRYMQFNDHDQYPQPFTPPNGGLL